MPFTFRTEPLKELVAEADESRLVLPNFQREFTWSVDQIRSLLASFLVSIPTGSLLLLKGKLSDYASRPLGTQHPLEENGEQPCQFLLDGQQRMSALKTAFYDQFEDSKQWKDTVRETYRNLSLRWFLRVRSTSLDLDPFGYQTLKFEGLSSLEPSDVTDFITSERILITKTNYWWHPGQVHQGESGILSGRKLVLALARQASEEGVIPLYEISKGDDGWLPKALELIADRRLDELRAEVGDHPESRVSKEVLENLQDIDEEVASFTAEGQDEVDRLNEAWQRLKLNWELELKKALFSSLEHPVPLIIAPSDEIERAVATFEAVNRGGTPLDNFDLVVARAAKDKEQENLSARIAAHLEEDLIIPASLSKSNQGQAWSARSMAVLDKNTPTNETKNWFLNLLSIIVHEQRGETLSPAHIKSKKILAMSAAEINDHEREATKALRRALAFLQFRCGLTAASELHYKLMLVPIALTLGEDTFWEDSSAARGLEYWYWTTIFAGSFRERQNERCIHSIAALRSWITDPAATNPFEGERSDLFNVKYYCDKTLLSRNKYEGHEEVSPIPRAVRAAVGRQFVLSLRPRDLLRDDVRLSAWTAATDEDIVLEDHHILPLFAAKTLKDSTKKLRTDVDHPLNSPLNMTPVLKDTNRKFGAMPPERYRDELKQEALLNHLIPLENDTMATGSPEEFLSKRFDQIKSRVIDHLDRLIE